MAAKIVLRVDPYQVQVRDGIDFTKDVIEPVFGMSDDWTKRAEVDSRWLEYRDATWLLLHNLSAHQTAKKPTTSHWVGSICKARTDELPQQVTAAGVSPLALPDDGGVVDHVAFLWEPDRKLLWLQRERDVGRIAVVDYLRKQSGVAIGLVPIFATDAPQQAKKLKDVKKLEVTYLVGKHSRERNPKGFFRVVNELEAYGAARIEIRVVPIRGGYLEAPAKQAVKEIADEVIENTGAIAKAKVWGDLSEEDAGILVDMLKERSDFSTAVDKEKSRDPDRLMKAVRNIWTTHRDDITV